MEKPEDPTGDSVALLGRMIGILGRKNIHSNKQGQNQEKQDHGVDKVLLFHKLESPMIFSLIIT